MDSFTDKEWAEIAGTLSILKPSDDALQFARTELNEARKAYVANCNTSPWAQRRKKELTEWRKIEKHAAELERLLQSRFNDDPSNAPDAKDWRGENFKLALARLRDTAKLQSFCENLNRQVRAPKANVRAWFHFAVLNVWTKLGGQLKFSRHPTQRYVKGPLPRYFSAVTKPVHEVSLETLPDIVKRHKVLMPLMERRQCIAFRKKLKDGSWSPWTEMPPGHEINLRAVAADADTQ